MPAKTVTKKRKSTDGDELAVKKVKVAKAADAPANLKSALKKPRPDKTESATKAASKVPKDVDQDTLKKSTSKKARSTAPTTSLDEEAGDNGDGTTELTADQTASLLAGFSSSEDEGEDDDAIPVSRLPQAPTTGDVQKRIKKAIAEQDNPETTPGVVYIGRIPHGFYEAQMRAYLSQFGDITRLRLARNKKTGASRHFAFVEFASAAVADIVVKTMDKYLLFGHLLQVSRVPKEQIKEKMFVGAKKHAVPRNRLERQSLNEGKVRESWGRKIDDENKRRLKKAEALKEMGYEFDMPMAKSVDTVAIKPKAIDAGEAPPSTVVEEAVAAVEPTTVEREVEEDADAPTIKETIVTKKRSAEGKRKAKKVVKKSRLSA